MAMAFGLGERCGSSRIIRVAASVNEKGVVPVAPTAGAFLNVRQIDPVVLKGLKHMHQRARLVRGREHHRGLVIAAAMRGSLGNHEEARDVVGMILDARKENAESVQLPSQFGTDRRNPRDSSGSLCLACFRSHDFRGPTAAGHRDQLGFRILRGKPFSTLDEDLGL